MNRAIIPLALALAVSTVSAATDPTHQRLIGAWAHFDDAEIFATQLLRTVEKQLVLAHPVQPSAPELRDDMPAWHASKTVFSAGVAPDLETFYRVWKDPVERSRWIGVDQMVPLIAQEACRPGIDGIVTHSPWGDYGHPHHRFAYLAARVVAVRCKLDLWTPAGVYDVTQTRMTRTHTGGMPYVMLRTEGEADFFAIRAAYEVHDAEHTPIAWTWGDGAQSWYGYANRPQPFVQVVRDGVDLSTSQWRADLIPIQPWHQETGTWDDYVDLN
jgi:hypothetical protein